VDALVGFHVDAWDNLTFAFIIVAAVLARAVSIIGLPGRIAVNLMGYIGFLAVVPWVKALIWAFKPTDVIDIRYMPGEERRETDAILARITGRTGPREEPSPSRQSHTS
jgi:hypothetical protein